MEKNEIKKLLYTAKPIAKIVSIGKGSAIYESNVNDLQIIFDIPVVDMGDAKFLPEMDAKLLIRWIV